MLIEPLPDKFEELKRNYNSCYANVEFSNVAISPFPGELILYRASVMRGSDVDAYLSTISSFDRSRIWKQIPSNLKDKVSIKDFSVPSLSLTKAIDQSSFEKLDVLVVDTEGFDDQVIYSLDFRKYRPALIYFEHGHLSPGALN